ncbi:MAG: hypothetical protein SGILL_003359 [Bacillariaceae sp.]
MIPYLAKTDTHWDFVMKEMMWLGADFQAERKRQFSLAKKCASSLRQFHQTKEKRRLRELASAEVKRRKLAARIGRDVRGWWKKVATVIAYKQRLEADEQRKKAMNKQLVSLVQQTEKYTESLAAGGDRNAGINDQSDTNGEASSDDDIGYGGKRGKTRKRRQQMTIEEALASEHSRKSKTQVLDYSKMKLKATEFYGESTASDASGSDGSFSAPDDSDESDDDSTLRAAMKEELQERDKQAATRFLPDPEELRKLHEEKTMDVDVVLQRLEKEGTLVVEEEDGVERKVEARPKRVVFADDAIQRRILTRTGSNPDPGAEADDDGDASDVEDYDEAKDHSDEEFEAAEADPDDETTMAQEESLPKEMSHAEEILMLKESAEIPIEELRKMYADESMQLEDGAGSEEQVKSDNILAGDDASDEDDYEIGEPEADDETTIAQEEGLPREMSYGEEIDLLKESAEMPIEELREMYAGMAAEGQGGVDEDPQEATTVLSSSDEGNLDDDDEYEDSAMPTIDDETTIEAEEKLGRDMTYREELDMLERENEMSVEELRAMYAGVDESSKNNDTMIADEGVGFEPEQATLTSRRRKRRRVESSGSNEQAGNNDTGPTSDGDTDEGAAALYALEASDKKARQTLASRPFLLAPWVKLRMYQQVGLNWLVSLQTRRLNGILADEVSDNMTISRVLLLSVFESQSSIYIVAKRWVLARLSKRSLCLRTWLPTKGYGDLT